MFTISNVHDVLIDKTIDIIIVEHKDRLARFGTNYIEKLINELNKDNEE